jgi:hypothetical protein
MKRLKHVPLLAALLAGPATGADEPDFDPYPLITRSLQRAQAQKAEEFNDDIYYDCLLDNIGKAQTSGAVVLINQACKHQARR